MKLSHQILAFTLSALSLSAALACGEQQSKCSNRPLSEKIKNNFTPEQLKGAVTLAITEGADSELAFQLLEAESGIDFYDLDEDGIDDAIVSMKGHFCGMAGCDIQIYKGIINNLDMPEFTFQSSIGRTKPPIKILNSKSNGWHDIGVHISGGGNTNGNDVAVKFNGKEYAGNPTVEGKFVTFIKGKMTGKELFVTPVQHITQATKSAVQRPEITAAENYSDVRQRLLSEGWKPLMSPDADVCGGSDERCQGRPEMESCAGTGMANCRFSWKKEGTQISICTVGMDTSVTGYCD